MTSFLSHFKTCYKLVFHILLHLTIKNSFSAIFLSIYSAFINKIPLVKVLKVCFSIGASGAGGRAEEAAPVCSHRRRRDLQPTEHTEWGQVQ